jgi:hypothetical protein
MARKNGDNIKAVQSAIYRRRKRDRVAASCDADDELAVSRLFGAKSARIHKENRTTLCADTERPLPDFLRTFRPHMWSFQQMHRSPRHSKTFNLITDVMTKLLFTGRCQMFRVLRSCCVANSSFEILNICNYEQPAICQVSVSVDPLVVCTCGLSFSENVPFIDCLQKSKTFLAEVFAGYYQKHVSLKAGFGKTYAKQRANNTFSLQCDK